MLKCAKQYGRFPTVVGYTICSGSMVSTAKVKTMNLKREILKETEDNEEQERIKEVFGSVCLEVFNLEVFLC